MKRYDLFSECLCGVGFAPLCEESTDGSWVSADIAQEMYDALKFCQDIDSLDDLMIFEDMVDRILAKADGD